MNDKEQQGNFLWALGLAGAGAGLGAWFYGASKRGLSFAGLFTQQSGKNLFDVSQPFRSNMQGSISVSPIERAYYNTLTGAVGPVFSSGYNVPPASKPLVSKYKSNIWPELAEALRKKHVDPNWWYRTARERAEALSQGIPLPGEKTYVVDIEAQRLKLATEKGPWITKGITQVAIVPFGKNYGELIASMRAESRIAETEGRKVRSLTEILTPDILEAYGIEFIKAPEGKVLGEEDLKRVGGILQGARIIAHKGSEYDIVELNRALTKAKEATLNPLSVHDTLRLAKTVMPGIATGGTMPRSLEALAGPLWVPEYAHSYALHEALVESQMLLGPLPKTSQYSADKTLLRNLYNVRQKWGGIFRRLEKEPKDLIGRMYFYAPEAARFTEGEEAWTLNRRSLYRLVEFTRGQNDLVTFTFEKLAPYADPNRSHISSTLKFSGMEEAQKWLSANLVPLGLTKKWTTAKRFEKRELEGLVRYHQGIKAREDLFQYTERAFGRGIYRGNKTWQEDMRAIVRTMKLYGDVETEQQFLGLLSPRQRESYIRYKKGMLESPVTTLRSKFLEVFARRERELGISGAVRSILTAPGLSPTQRMAAVGQFFKELDVMAPATKTIKRPLMPHEIVSGGPAETDVAVAAIRKTTAALREADLQTMAERVIGLGARHPISLPVGQSLLSIPEERLHGTYRNVEGAMRSIQTFIESRGFRTAVLQDENQQLIHFLFSTSGKRIKEALATLESGAETTTEMMANVKQITVPYSVGGFIYTGDVLKGGEKLVKRTTRSILVSEEALEYSEDRLVRNYFLRQFGERIVGKTGVKGRIFSFEEMAAAETMRRLGGYFKKTLGERGGINIRERVAAGINQLSRFIPRAEDVPIDYARTAEIYLKYGYPKVTLPTGYHVATERQLQIQALLEEFPDLFYPHFGKGAREDVALLRRTTADFVGKYWPPERPVQSLSGLSFEAIESRGLPEKQQWRLGGVPNLAEEMGAPRRSLLLNVQFVGGESPLAPLVHGGSIVLAEDVPALFGKYKKVVGGKELRLPVTIGTAFHFGTGKGTVGRIVPRDMLKAAGIMRYADMIIQDQTLKHMDSQQLLESIYWTTRYRKVRGTLSAELIQLISGIRRGETVFGDIPEQQLLDLFEKGEMSKTPMIIPVSIPATLPYPEKTKVRLDPFQLEWMRSQGMGREVEKIIQHNISIRSSKTSSGQIWRRNVEYASAFMMYGTREPSKYWAGIERATGPSIPEEYLYGNLGELTDFEIERLHEYMKEKGVTGAVGRFELPFEVARPGGILTRERLLPTVMPMLVSKAEGTYRIDAATRQAYKLYGLVGEYGAAAEEKRAGLAAEIMAEDIKYYETLSKRVGGKEKGIYRQMMMLEVPEAGWGRSVLALEGIEGGIGAPLDLPGVIRKTPRTAAAELGLAETEVLGKTYYGVVHRPPDFPLMTQIQVTPDLYMADVNIRNMWEAVRTEMQVPKDIILHHTYLENLLKTTKAEKQINRITELQSLMSEVDKVVAASRPLASAINLDFDKDMFQQIYATKGEAEKAYNAYIMSAAAQKHIEKGIAPEVMGEPIVDLVKSMRGMSPEQIKVRFGTKIGWMAQFAQFGVGPTDIPLQKMIETFGYKEPGAMEAIETYWQFKQKAIDALKKLRDTQDVSAEMIEELWTQEPTYSRLRGALEQNDLKKVMDVGREIGVSDLEEDRVRNMLTMYSRTQGTRLTRQAAARGTLTPEAFIEELFGARKTVTQTYLQNIWGTGTGREAKTTFGETLGGMWRDVPKGAKTGALVLGGLYMLSALLRNRDQVRPVEGMPQTDRAPMVGGATLPPPERRQVVRSDLKEPWRDFEDLFIDVKGRSRNSVEPQTIADATHTAIQQATGLTTDINVQTRDHRKGVRDITSIALKDAMYGRLI